MNTQSNACVCDPCAGASCTCGCQTAAPDTNASCQCGDVCTCGEACTCNSCQHATAATAETR